MKHEVPEKEESFMRDYASLIEKHGVSLIVETRSDEYGSYVHVIFKEAGDYCNIHYEPEYELIEHGYQGMGR